MLNTIDGMFDECPWLEWMSAPCTDWQFDGPFSVHIIQTTSRDMLSEQMSEKLLYRMDLEGNAENNIFTRHRAHIQANTSLPTEAGAVEVSLIDEEIEYQIEDGKAVLYFNKELFLYAMMDAFDDPEGKNDSLAKQRIVLPSVVLEQW